MTKLRKRVVGALRPNPDGKDMFLWDSGDGALKGFGVRMKPSGTAAYIVQYRTAEGRTRRLALGKVGTLTPDEARGLARDKLVAVTKGADPSAERHRGQGIYDSRGVVRSIFGRGSAADQSVDARDGPEPDRSTCQAAAGAPHRAGSHARRRREEAARHRRR